MQVPLNQPPTANTVEPFAADGRAVANRDLDRTNESDAFATVEETAETEKSRVDKRSDDQVTLSSKEELAAKLAEKQQAERLSEERQQQIRVAENRAQSERQIEAQQAERRAESAQAEQRQAEQRQAERVEEPSSQQEPSRARQQQEIREQRIETEQIRQLAQRDREVRAHEAAHASVGGQYAGAASYTFQRGPDGVAYAVGGEVPIDVSEVSGNPEATAQKMEQVRRAALAPAEPSAQDRRVASLASQKELQALAAIQEQIRAEQQAESAAESDRKESESLNQETREVRVEKREDNSDDEDRSEKILENFERINESLTEANRKILQAVQEGDEVQKALGLLDESV